MNFKPKIAVFPAVFCPNSLSRDLGFPKLAHMTLLLILMFSSNFNFLDLNRLQFMSKAIFIYQNGRKKIVRACTKCQLKATWKQEV